MPFFRRPLPRRAPPVHLQGFSLMESLVVITLISVIVTAASPTFIRLLRDRRVNRAAMHLVDAYRTGRTRAMGHGQPILVVWDPASGGSNAEPGSNGLVRILEPVVTGTSQAASCVTAPWGTAGAVQEYFRVDFKNGRYTYTNAQFFDDAGNPASYGEMCFAPSGRTYFRTGAGLAFHAMTGVPYFTISNVDTGTASDRKVFIPPNGVARLQL